MIQFKKIHEDAILPCRKHKGDAGLDVFALETFQLRRREQKVVQTGIVLAGCPDDVGLFVWPKSGLDAEFGISTGAGVIEPTYRGEILILVRNMSSFAIQIEKGDAFAQLVPLKLANEDVEEVDSLEETERGADGGIARSINNED